MNRKRCFQIFHCSCFFFSSGLTISMQSIAENGLQFSHVSPSDFYEQGDFCTYHPFRVDLVADVNRDGWIDFLDDEQAEDLSLGVIVLPNIDDDSHRCDQYKVVDDNQLRESTQFIDCNDSTDAQSNGKEDIEDLSLAYLYADGYLPSTAKISLSLIDNQGKLDTSNKFRVMVRRGETFVDITQSPLTNSDLYYGTDITLEAKDALRSPTFFSPGTLSEESDGNIDGYEQTPPTIESLTPENVSRRFLNDMEYNASDVVGDLVVLKDTGSDIWVQDIFEPAFVARPAPWGSQKMRVVLQSANESRSILHVLKFLDLFQGKSDQEIFEYIADLGDEEYFALYERAHEAALTNGGGYREATIALFSELRGNDTGVVRVKSQYLGGYADTYNSTGNFTTAPPNFAANDDYPLGRMIYGSTPNTRFLSILESQQQQNAIWVDTSWLNVGHVDEFLTVLPSNARDRGWVLGVADPGLAYQALEAASQYSTPNELSILDGAYVQDFEGELPAISSLSRKLSDFLNDEIIRKANDFAAKKINESLNVLREQLQLNDEDIVRIPALYVDHSLSNIEEEPSSLSSYIPNAVNGVFIGENTFISPRQFSTQLNGADVLQELTEKALTSHGIQVRWVDDYHYAHRGDGEIHCVSNAFRDLSDVENWWLY